ncbi:uncharacterized protein LOC126707113 [Quercus robur]|uniref:uncharacterized protein LOC126707113 n=1 Tax=Quercus robur TaxID=38942 RepID=UPI00216323BB|nr:uncharacterized protein LOC126707113 [Quercus robur]
MSASDHCLQVLWLERKVCSRSPKRRFLFEAMWSRDERCKKVIEEAWDPLRVDPNFQIHDRLRNCQTRLQRWNREVFKNVNKVLKVRQEHLQDLEVLNMLHKTASEIEKLRKEINEALTQEEVMWNQRSRALWMKCGDRNTKFFHAMATQRQRHNMIEGLWGADGQWHEEKRKKIKEIIIYYFKNIF